MCRMCGRKGAAKYGNTNFTDNHPQFTEIKSIQASSSAAPGSFLAEAIQSKVKEAF